MHLLILVTIITILVVIFLIFKSVKRDSSAITQRFWLFYAGSENYLDRNGERDFQGKILWSCDPSTRKGDLILLYRKSINKLTVNVLMRRFKMTKEVAQDIKKRGIGKDISALWQAVSDSRRQSLWRWSHGCYVQEIQKLKPPVRMEELRSVPELRRWTSLRWNFQAGGRSALEIPPFAWEILSKVIESKCGVKINRDV
jgi:hypothetical protein